MGDSENRNNEELEQNEQPEADKREKAAKQEKKRGRFQGLKAEFKRIIWPDKDTIIKETTAVLVVTVILGVVIALLDLLIKTGLDKLLQIG